MSDEINLLFHNFIENDLKINIIGVNRLSGYYHQEKFTSVDYLVYFLTFDIYSEEQ